VQGCAAGPCLEDWPDTNFKSLRGFHFLGFCRLCVDCKEVLLFSCRKQPCADSLAHTQISDVNMPACCVRD
jgi:hypothetical protein